MIFVLTLISKIDILKKSLDETDEIKNINLYYNMIVKNKKLTDKINEYKNNFNKYLKQDIYTYDEFKKYKKTETEVSLLIMEINSKLKKITNSGDIYESN